MFKKTALGMAAALTSTLALAADVENSNLQVNFESAHLQGAGNQITMLRVPVTNKETGKTNFFDMSAQFAVDKNGNLTFKNISSVTSVPLGSANQLVAGHYLDTDGCSWFVEGPSVGSQERLVWSVYKPGNNVGCKDSSPRSGQVMSGPLVGNEFAKSLKSYSKLVKNDDLNLNYGVYKTSYLLSASQTGNTISFLGYQYSSADVAYNWTVRAAPYPGKKEDE